MTGVKTAPMVDVDWLTRAACREWPAGMWDLLHGGLTEDNVTAQGICRWCPVTLECAAATSPADEGVIRASFPIRSRVEAVAIRDAAREAVAAR